MIELEHGFHRANSAELARKRRDYLDTVFAAIPVESFTKEMGQGAAKIDADAKKAGTSSRFRICSLVLPPFTSIMRSGLGICITSR